MTEEIRQSAEGANRGGTLNAGVSGDAPRGLSEEQSALRRVATMVARGAPHAELFTAVTEEVTRLLNLEYAEIGRYEPGGTVLVVAAWSEAGQHLPVGSRWSLGGTNLMTTVSETARPARIDVYPEASGELGLAARDKGVRSAVATPILVEGSLWGVVVAGCMEARSLPPDTEARLASFTELVATAIANAESRARLALLAEEQAALRRVATLVARGTLPERLFAAMTEEIGRLLPVQYAYMGRYEADGMLAVVASWGQVGEYFRAGRRDAVGGKNLVTKVFETGSSARIDDLSDLSGALGVAAREAGFRSAVGTPILVDSTLWGVMIAGTKLEELMPPDTEERLSSFIELLAMAIANAESHAALAASRARIVAAGDESRRRIERDLHDGAQQRLVHAVIVLKLALAALPSSEVDARDLVGEALGHAEQANSELRELAHGILPGALSRGGLRAGVEALTARVLLPVSVDVQVGRLADGVEATAYFVISEALTNVVKHAAASGAQVKAAIEHGQLRVEVSDDGIGGARGGYGSGLGGLEDRVAALGGQLTVDSPEGVGTRICAVVPLRVDDQAPGESRR
jgi:signal transduction histidine kinase